MPVVVVRTNYPTGGGWTRGDMINRNYVDVTGPFKTNRQALRAASELREEPGKCFGDSPCMCIDEDDTKAEQKRKKQACTCWEQQGYADAPPWDSSSVWHGAGSTAECIEIMPQALHEDDVEEDAEFMAAGVDQPSLGVTSRQHAVHHAEQEKAANKRRRELESERRAADTKRAEQGIGTNNASVRVRRLKNAKKEYGLTDEDLAPLPHIMNSYGKTWHVMDLAQARDAKFAAASAKRAKPNDLEAGSASAVPQTAAVAAAGGSMLF